jgi:drug/metabolite transporter (DMT)-like permease
MMPAPDAPLPARDWAILGGLSLLWGGSFFLDPVLAPVLPPVTLVLGRVAISALTLWPVLLLGQGMRPSLRLCAWFLMLGLVNCALPFCLFAWSERHLTSGMAALLNAPTPIVTALLAHASRDERLTRRTLVGVLFGFAGVAVLIGPGLGRELAGGLAAKDLLAELACLLATLSYAVGTIAARRLRGVTPLQLATGQVSGASVLMLPLAVFGDRFWTLPPLGASGWAALLGIAVVSTSLAYLLFFQLLASAGATRAGLVTFLVPVSALLLGFVFLGESVAVRDIPAIALIGLGLAVIDGRLLRRLQNISWRARMRQG